MGSSLSGTVLTEFMLCTWEESYVDFSIAAFDVQFWFQPLEADPTRPSHFAHQLNTLIVTVIKMINCNCLSYVETKYG